MAPGAAGRMVIREGHARFVADVIPALPERLGGSLLEVLREDDLRVALDTDVTHIARREALNGEGGGTSTRLRRGQRHGQQP